MNRILEKYPDTAPKGISGEKFLLSYLNRCGYTINDYTNNITAQYKGYDFGIDSQNWIQEYTLDCKNNLYVTKEFLAFKIELYKPNNVLGWFFKSKADRIYHVSTYKKSIMYYNLHEFRSIILNYILEGINLTNDHFKIVNYNNNVLIQCTFKYEDLKKFNLTLANV